ncbi:MAG TPA: FecR domain-containing protein [Chitinophaga sp.]|nr:FecR domain-containing protein [Chitinophaga sp.]
MNNERLKYLLGQWLEGKITMEEENELTASLEQHRDSEVVPELLQHFLDNTVTDHISSMQDRERILSNILQTDKTVHLEAPGQQAIPLRASFLQRWGWAAAVILLLGTGAIVVRSLTGSRKTPNAVVQDIAPGSNKATLTLGDGSTVTLDSSGNQVIAAQVRQAGAQLIYDVQHGNTTITYNTLTTPRGGQFQVRLPDGTKVWLNAASMLRYPTSFTGRERMVELSGEAYFEVAKNTALPFKVKIGHQGTVEVLGTHFNVDAYPDELNINTTLLEGAVRVSAEQNQVVLKAGQQAQMANGRSQEGITVVNNADVDKVMAWKNGLFNFDNVSLKEVMRELARWYDIQIVYEANVPDMYFEGEMSREMNLSQVLAGLQQAGVRFRIEEGKRLVVLKQ